MVGPLHAEILRGREALREKEAAAAEARARAEQAQKIAEACDHEVAVAAARLQGLETAANLLRQPVSESPERPVSRRGGRQRGSISRVWRDILADIARLYPEGATDEQIAEIGRVNKLSNLGPRDARRQMQKYEQSGFVDYANRDRSAWYVTSEGIRKFGIEVPSESKAATDSAAAPEFWSAPRG